MTDGTKSGDVEDRQPRKVLVTGGCGFVGRNLISSVLRRWPGSSVWCIDDLSTGLAPGQWPELALEEEDLPAGTPFRSYALPGSSGRVRFIEADLLRVLLHELGRSRAEELDDLELPTFDRVYHLAAIVGGRLFVETQPLAIGLDLAIDALLLLWAATKSRPERLLYASSSAAYPMDHQRTPDAGHLDESLIDFGARLGVPDLAYGWSKLSGEMLVQFAVQRYDLQVSVVRPFSGYGEHQDVVYPVPATALKAAARRDPLTVWGTGEQQRDFIHIDDCVTGMHLVCENVIDGTAVNLGSGVPKSMNEIAALIARIVGYEPEIAALDALPQGAASRYADTTRARSLVGFAPTVGLAEGMQRVVEVAHRRLAAGAAVPTN